MKKYILKDKVLFNWLCENSDGFNKEFQKACAQGFKNDYCDFICLSFLPDENSVLWDEEELTFKKSAIECVEVYDPYAWNNYQETTPPEGVLMRVETGGGRKFCGYYHFFAEGGCWCYEDGTVCPEAISKSVKRFRPWED